MPSTKNSAQNPAFHFQATSTGLTFRNFAVINTIPAKGETIKETQLASNKSNARDTGDNGSASAINTLPRITTRIKGWMPAIANKI